MLNLVDRDGGSPPNPHVVKIIEDMLAAAKAGRVQGIAGVALKNCGNAQVYLHPGNDDLALSILGGLEMTKIALVENFLEVPLSD